MSIAMEEGTKVFIEMLPVKEKEVCANCKYWNQWGVSTGTCILSDNEDQNTDQDYTCISFRINQIKLRR